MAKVTLIGRQLAEKDNEFTYLGPLEDCKNCKLSHICFNLKPYHPYKILKVRKKRHACTVHQNNVVVVEVEKQPITVAINKKHTKGSTTIIDKIQCDQKLCKHYTKCVTPALKADQKYKIISTKDNIQCPKNKSLQTATVSES